MKLENQVCSLELAKKLKELGVPQESLWYGLGESITHNPNNDAVSVFTVAELGHKIGMHYHIRTNTTRGNKQWSVTVQIKEYGIGAAVCPKVYTQKADTEANARAKMLVYLLENKLIEV